MLEDITQRLQRYLFTLVISNVLIALCAWAFFAWMGIEQPALWGELTGLFHVVPYIGTTVVAVASMVNRLPCGLPGLPGVSLRRLAHAGVVRVAGGSRADRRFVVPAATPAGEHPQCKRGQQAQ